MADNTQVAYKQIIALTNQLVEANKRLAEQTKANIIIQDRYNKELKEATSAKQFAAVQKKIEGNIKATALAEKQAIKIEQEREKLMQQQIRTATAQANAARRQQRETEKLNSLYKQESARLTKLRNAAKETALQFGLTSKEFKKAAAEVNKLDQRLKKVDTALGQSQRFVGQYEKGMSKLGGSLRGLAGAFGFVGGVQLLARAFGDVLRVSREYEKQNAVLAGVLGKTRKETKELQKESKRLGASTAFSASEVVDLQVSLARLGKTEAEIIASTEGIIDATIALGAETGETAALVGATLNTFNLAASESGHVADVLTLSTQKSALSFEKLNTALPIAQGAAAAAGVSFERMVAQLGQAADRGIDASTAATSLRNIYIELAAKGLTLDEALTQINTSQDKLTVANELFGKRAAVTALALAETTDKTDGLTSALENAGGTAKRVAEEQLNTLDGRLRLLNSAWEGFILAINDGDSALGAFASGTVNFATRALTWLTNSGLAANASFK
jgi:hypothetical protein